MQNRTLSLNSDTWDIQLDDSGNLAVVNNPYSVAQDVATACSLYLGECVYDNTIGIPYNTQIMGFIPGSGLIQSYLQNEAMRLDYVSTAQATIINDQQKRQSYGVITIVDTNGTTSTVNM
ncbi:hypothetical protein [Dickeya poaceiphila]|uniref:Uncharacterized protein n=1 Tax=Dickeya poaceiphila TaxID=568768 RepID=A0A5B8I4R1_9GAMM|nr:hypothetical protein [Dickeya poaceiphila]QDX29573.1 hypothetical protein Dpoa569_0001361 [Dickeya poaceiphila]